MPIIVKHAFVSGKAAVGGSDKVQGPHWDADHSLVDSATGTPFSGGTLVPAGAVLDYAGMAVPAGWLECYGQVVAAASYPALFAALVKTATVTITANATPAVVSWTGHGLKVGDDVSFTGGIHAGIIDSDVQKYRIISAGFSANSFRFSLTWEGVAINTGAAGSGAITGIHAPYGVSLPSFSNFGIPDFRGSVLGGVTNMGGSQTSKMALGYQTGFEQGAETVVLATANLPAHSHTHGANATVQSGTGATVTGTGAGSATGLTGSATPVKVMQPTDFIRKIIYTGL